jgi:hypothetical protein
MARARRSEQRSVGFPGGSGRSCGSCSENASKSKTRYPITPAADEAGLSVAPQIGQRFSRRAISGSFARTRMRHAAQLRCRRDITRPRCGALWPSVTQMTPSGRPGARRVRRAPRHPEKRSPPTERGFRHRDRRSPSGSCRRCLDRCETLATPTLTRHAQRGRATVQHEPALLRWPWPTASLPFSERRCPESEKSQGSPDALATVPRSACRLGNLGAARHRRVGVRAARCYGGGVRRAPRESAIVRSLGPS